MFRNNPYRGDLIVQTHTTSDVVLQLPVAEAGVVQTDELEHDLVPAPDTTGVLPANLPAFLENYYAPLVPDFDLAQGEPHQFAAAPDLTPLNVDVRENKALIIQYRDRDTVGENYDPATFYQFTDPYTGADTGFRKLQAYRVTVVIQIEELI